MSKSNVFETDLLELIFNGVTIPNLADDTVTSPATTLTVALHTADPGETGTMLTSEATYGNYGRVTVARTAGGWTITGNSVSPADDIVFPQANAGTNTITHFSVGTGVSDNILYYGTVTPNIAVSDGVQPVLDTATTITED